MQRECAALTLSTGREEEEKGSVLKDTRAKLHVTGAVDKKSSGGGMLFLGIHKLTQAKYCINRTNFTGN